MLLPLQTAKTLLTGLAAQLDTFKRPADDNERDAFMQKARMLIRQIYGPQSEYLKDLEHISFYPMVISFDGNDPQVDWEAWTSGWNRTKNLIDTMLDEINLLEQTGNPAPQTSTVKKAPSTKEVFIVHGHDDAMKQAVARTLDKLGLKPIILHEQPNKGRTLIEKLSDHTDVAFAVVLLSSDDLGYSKEEGPQAAKPRARQNVVFELGLLTGKIGRHAVAVLFPPTAEFEMPTDYEGMAYIPYDQYGSWQFSLVKELQAFGFSVSADSLTKAT